ncbi:hypothetical protein [Salinicoccus halodurans]|uniref:Uncharacterized protein n=1 Tax=Salinicoccus halodurans TaxID=407035 RepID=A0A0F7D519_9STAP|nr:hypothetical protein [Salinicoccus halodurans]AKG75215.1 hypothetical protein AAT16_01070 [Salinicoccus halodurans]SFK76352.1 hypothetical protein SAMN05216235_1586 [Salinicoccus halodurans]
MDTDLNLKMLTEKLTAYQISRAVDISIDKAQSIIDKEINYDELDSETIVKLKTLSDKLNN